METFVVNEDKEFVVDISKKRAAKELEKKIAYALGNLSKTWYPTVQLFKLVAPDILRAGDEEQNPNNEEILQKIAKTLGSIHMLINHHDATIALWYYYKKLHVPADEESVELLQYILRCLESMNEVTKSLKPVTQAFFAVSNDRDRIGCCRGLVQSGVVMDDASFNEYVEAPLKKSALELQEVLERYKDS